MAMIEVEDLRKNYGSFRALLGITFQVDRGEILGFLGPNGAGKTTTMKILTGSLNPSSGTARVGGHDVMENSVEVRRQIGYLPESTPLYGDMTVKEYLTYCGRLRRMGGSRLRQRREAVVHDTALEPKLRAPIKTLSKGYRQRVGIAQALLHEPEIIILDEPTVGLDPNQVVDVRNLIRSIGENRTVILCSHILSEVEAVCGRVIIVHEGQIAAEGSPKALGESLSGTVFTEVTVQGSAAALEEALRSVAGIERVTLTGEASGRASAQFEAPSRTGDLGARVARAIADAGLELHGLAPRRATLEDVFRQCTRSGKEVA